MWMITCQKSASYSSCRSRQLGREDDSMPSSPIVLQPRGSASPAPDKENTPTPQRARRALLASPLGQRKDSKDGDLAAAQEERARAEREAAALSEACGRLNAQLAEQDRCVE